MSEPKTQPRTQKELEGLIWKYIGIFQQIEIVRRDKQIVQVRRNGSDVKRKLETGNRD